MIVLGASHETVFSYTGDRGLTITAAKEFKIGNPWIPFESNAVIAINGQMRMAVKKELTVSWSPTELDRGFFRYALTVGDVQNELLKIYKERNPGAGLSVKGSSLLTEGAEPSEKTGTELIGAGISDLASGLKPVIIPVAVILAVGLLGFAAVSRMKAA